MNDKPGRNSSCPCGSGKKFKKCCGLNLTPAQEELIAPISDAAKSAVRELSDSYATCYQIKETRKEELIQEDKDKP